MNSQEDEEIAEAEFNQRCLEADDRLKERRLIMHWERNDPPINKIKSSKDAYQMFFQLMGDKPYEEFHIILLNRANIIIGTEKISEGGISGTVVDPKKVFHKALGRHASSMILGHNHPSGVLTPSEADCRITKKLVDAGLMLEIKVLDHLIVGSDAYYSFADEGAL